MAARSEAVAVRSFLLKMRYFSLRWRFLLNSRFRSQIDTDLSSDLMFPDQISDF